VEHLGRGMKNLIVARNVAKTFMENVIVQIVIFKIGD